MDTKVEALEGDNVKVTVTVDEKAVDDEIARTYRDLARRHTFPGFRKGKAPRPVVDNAFGGSEAVLSVVTDELVNGVYPAVVEQERLFPMGKPVLDEDMGPVVEGKPYTFSFSLAVKPAFELSSYEPVEIEVPAAGATEAEVDEQLELLQEHYSAYEDAPASTKLKEDNQAEIAMTATDAQGEPIELLESESRVYEPGTPLFSAAFDEQLLGMKKGESKSFTLEVPADESALFLAPHAGQPVSFEVTVNAVKKRVAPGLTDEWARDVMGFEGVEDLRKNVEEGIASRKEEVIPRIKESAASSELAKRLEADAPEAMVEEEEAALLQDFFTQLQRQGASFDAYLAQEGLSSDQFKEDVKLQAADNVKQRLALDAWARHAGIDVTDEEVSEEFARAGVDDPKGLEEQWRKQGRLHLVREGVSRAKALEDAIATAKVTEVDFAKRAAEHKAKEGKASE